MMFADPTEEGRVQVMALSWNYFVDYCKDYITAVVAMDRAAMSWKVRALKLKDEALSCRPGPDHDDTFDHRNSESAIVHHCLFLRYYNMDPRWNCLGYQSILTGVMSVAAMIVVSKSWLNRPTTTSVAFRFTQPLEPRYVSAFVSVTVAICFASFLLLLAASFAADESFFFIVSSFSCYSFAFLVPLIDCWCCALIKFDHVPFFHSALKFD